MEVLIGLFMGIQVMTGIVPEGKSCIEIAARLNAEAVPDLIADNPDATPLNTLYACAPMPAPEPVGEPT